MNIFEIWLQNWADRRASRKILRRIEGDAKFSEKFSSEKSSIYRVPLPESAAISVLIENTEQHYSFSRGLFELFGAGHRIYILDGAPGALFGKPSAVFVFKGFFFRQVFLGVGAGNITVNGRNFPFFNAAMLSRLAIYNAGILVGLQEYFIHKNLLPDINLLPSPDPLALPWPVEDSDQPSEPLPPGGGPPHFLFYGICFQGLSHIDDIGQRQDPLWNITNEVGIAFQRRGYRSRVGLAGYISPQGRIPPPDSFDVMMRSVEHDIPQTYCDSVHDQLVLFVAAHGYAVSSEENPTDEIAMKWQTVSGRTLQWITHSAFWDRLVQIAAMRRHPEKLFVIIFSCRSGNLNDIRPSELEGVHLLTSTQDGTEVCYPNFGDCLAAAVRSENNNTWGDMINELEDCIRRAPGDKATPGHW